MSGNPLIVEDVHIHSGIPTIHIMPPQTIKRLYCSGRLFGVEWACKNVITSDASSSTELAPVEEIPGTGDSQKAMVVELGNASPSNEAGSLARSVPTNTANGAALSLGSNTNDLPPVAATPTPPSMPPPELHESYSPTVDTIPRQEELVLQRPLPPPSLHVQFPARMLDLLVHQVHLFHLSSPHRTKWTRRINSHGPDCSNALVDNSMPIPYTHTFDFLMISLGDIYGIGYGRLTAPPTQVIQPFQALLTRVKEIVEKYYKFLNLSPDFDVPRMSLGMDRDPGNYHSQEELLQQTQEDSATTTNKQIAELQRSS
ncbi:hypothetical protein M413DRAFT_420553 [Hebeloma cylindrosporum]|uniref:Uncharacterized protein n=1 Tax=Hebeloma cylindrosporum TaxID=76867 RepID=A0A0C2YBP9_HEBCY|nr:hypothetical protein M413DRAFT_420553 [Hebeloma cylindrosporum h7]